MREDEFQLYADVIRSDQMPAPDVVALFKEEPEFQKWYQAKYLQDPHEAALKLERWAERNPENSWVQETALMLIRKLTSVTNCRK